MEEKQWYNGKEALQYLRERWGAGFENWSAGAFRAHCFRWNIEAPLSTGTANFWDKKTLDNIPKPDIHRERRPSRRKKSQQAGGEDMHHRC